MSISTNNADSFQGGSSTSASSNNIFPPFIGAGGGGLVPAGSDGDILLILSADISNSTTTGIQVPDLSFPMKAGRLYLVEGFLWSDAPGSTIGFRFLHGSENLSLSPPDPANQLLDWFSTISDSANSLTTVLYTAQRRTSSLAYTTGSSSLNSPFDTPHKFVTLCRAASVGSGFGSVTDMLDFYFRSEVAGSAVVIKAGSFLRIREMI